MESDIQYDIVKYLEKRGYLVIRLNAGVAENSHTHNRIKLAPAGSPDLVVFLGLGRTLFIEVKSEKGTLEPTQADMHRLLIESLQHNILIARSVEDVVFYLNSAPDGDPVLVKQVVYHPRTRSKLKAARDAQKGYVPFEEWEAAGD